MRRQQTDSRMSGISMSGKAANAMRVTGPMRSALLLARWTIGSPYILGFCAVLILSSALVGSYILDQWHWFQRFGAVTVSIGAILSTRRLLRVRKRKSAVR